MPGGGAFWRTWRDGRGDKEISSRSGTEDRLTGVRGWTVGGVIHTGDITHAEERDVEQVRGGGIDEEEDERVCLRSDA